MTLLVILAMFAVGWKMVSSVSTDPAVVKAATLSMADIKPPADLEPKVKMDVILAKAIVYQSADRESTLILLQIARWMAQQDAGQNQQFGEGFRKNFGDGGADIQEQELKIEKSEVQDVKIRGQVSKVRFSEAKTPDGIDFRIVEAEFPGDDGPILLHLQRPLKKYDEAEVKQFLESIK